MIRDQKLIPYRTKIRRTKVSKFQLGVENFVRRNILSVENFVQYFNTKVRQKSDKTVEISAWCRKFCPTKYFVRRKFCPTKFCPIRYLSIANVLIIFGRKCVLVSKGAYIRGTYIWEAYILGILRNLHSWILMICLHLIIFSHKRGACL